MPFPNASCDVPPLKAKCRSRGGGVLEVTVLDVSAIGCMIDRKAWSVRVDDRILVKLEGLSYQPATVVWVEDEHAGIMFEQPLYEPVFMQLRQACEAWKAAAA